MLSILTTIPNIVRALYPSGNPYWQVTYRQGLREKSLESIEYHMNKFAVNFHGKKVTDFTRQMLDDYINKTYKYDRNRFNTLRQFFGLLSGASQATPIDKPILRETPSGIGRIFQSSALISGNSKDIILSHYRKRIYQGLCSLTLPLSELSI